MNTLNKISATKIMVWCWKCLTIHILQVPLSLSLPLTHTHTNSKHWFTTSFLQPLPDLVIKFVTNNSHYIRHLFYVAMLLTPAQIKPKSFELRRNFFFLPGVDASVYVHPWVLGCFHSLISTQTFQRALTALVDSCVEIKSAPSVA